MDRHDSVFAYRGAFFRLREDHVVDGIGTRIYFRLETEEGTSLDTGSGLQEIRKTCDEYLDRLAK